MPNDPLALSQTQFVCNRAMTGSSGSRGVERIVFFFFFAGSFTCLATGQTGQTNTTPQKAQRAREWVPPAPATTNSAELHREFLAESCLLSVSYPPLQHCCSWTKKNTPKRCPCKCKWLTVKCVFILARVI